MSEHTKGPWAVGKSDYGYLAVLPPRHGERGPDGVEYRPVVICRVADGYGRSEAEAQANARLIAETPEFLRIACDLLEFWDHGTPVHPGAEVVAELRALVARVTA